MLSTRWGGATAVTVLVAALALSYLSRRGEHEALATTPGSAGGPGLRGTLVAPGIDPLLCMARCRKLPEDGSVQEADLDADGAFAFPDLVEADYRLEIVVRSNPALVVARQDVRPGPASLVLESDPAFVFGPVQIDEWDGRPR